MKRLSVAVLVASSIVTYPHMSAEAAYCSAQPGTAIAIDDETTLEAIRRSATGRCKAGDPFTFAHNLYGVHRAAGLMCDFSKSILVSTIPSGQAVVTCVLGPSFK